MVQIKNLKIEGFRGINNSFEVDFENEKTLTSFIIYGRNGTGKSSITDAWEWIRNNKIDHLAKENAGDSEYAHKKTLNTNVSITLADGTQDINLNCNFKDKKQIFDNKDDELFFKSLLKYPCHIRYADLQTFVYKTKTQKYELLMKFLGYDYLLKIQNDFQTCFNNLKLNLDEEDKKVKLFKQGILNKLTLSEFKDEEIKEKINLILQTYKLSIDSLDNLQAISPQLKTLIEKDKFKIKINNLNLLKQNIESIFEFKEFPNKIILTEELFKELNKDNNDIVTKLLQIYQDTSAYLKVNNTNTCPICEKDYNEGELSVFVEDKNNNLKELKQKKDDFIQKKQELLEQARKIIQNLKSILENEENSSYINEINFKKIQEFLVEIKTLDIDFSKINEFNYSQKEEFNLLKDFLNNENILIQIIGQIKLLNDQNDTPKLIDDYALIEKLLEDHNQYSSHKKRRDEINSNYEKFEFIFKEYNLWLKDKITKTFELISGDLTKFFNVLEGSSSVHLGKPEIKLLDKDKAIELEIEFENQKISPAFKLLSESQINSYGLAIFLSCIRHFNKEFKFLILDDVINSLDGHKKLNLINLIKEHFSDFQILILTHEILWFQQIIDNFKNWKKIKFTGWDLEGGPKVKLGRNSIENIMKDIEDDSPYYAGQKLGRYLEYKLRLLNVNFQSNVKCRHDNEYTLSELFDSFKSRVKSELTRENIIYKKLESMDIIFRNFATHYKINEANLTTKDIQGILNKWLETESLIGCECNIDVKFNGNYFICGCGKLNLSNLKENIK